MSPAPISIKHPRDVSRLRRIALAAQGLLQAGAFGRGLGGAHEAIKHIAYVQIDSISVVERAHHHVLHSRVPNYTPDLLDTLLHDKNIFEYWSHAAAFLPIDDFRFSLPYKHAIKSGQTHWYKNRDTKLMSELLARVRAEGPLRARDVEAPKKNSKSSGWWDWKPAKKALEQLYMEGDLMVCSRAGFQKSYDLTERVLPPQVNQLMPSIEELAEHLVEQQLRCHGFASLKGLTYLRKNTGLRQAVKALLDEKLSQQQYQQLQVPSGEVFVIEAGALDRPMPRLNSRLVILSPFDNSVIQRDRLRAVFDYNYLIECYVPAAKRQYGYFCLPLLYQGEFVGRIDCKAHRKIRQLEIKSLHWQDPCFDTDKVMGALAKSIIEFCKFQQCDSVSVANIQAKSARQALHRQLTPLIALS
jgi:uncharacterized protein YcaQ